jgi:hypothetical protein
MEARRFRLEINWNCIKRFGARFRNGSVRTKSEMTALEAHCRDDRCAGAAGAMAERRQLGFVWAQARTAL